MEIENCWSKGTKKKTTNRANRIDKLSNRMKLNDVASVRRMCSQVKVLTFTTALPIYFIDFTVARPLFLSHFAQFHFVPFSLSMLNTNNINNNVLCSRKKKTLKLCDVLNRMAISTLNRLPLVGLVCFLLWLQQTLSITFFFFSAAWILHIASSVADAHPACNLNWCAIRSIFFWILFFLSFVYLIGRKSDFYYTRDIGGSQLMLSN